MSARQSFDRILRAINVVHPEYDEFLKMFDRFYPETGEPDRIVSPVRRFVFCKDDDGHEFMIPVELEAGFNVWVESDTEADDFDPDAYYEYAIDGHRYSFTDPRQDI